METRNPPSGFDDSVVIVDSSGQVLEVNDHFRIWPGHAAVPGASADFWSSEAAAPLVQRRFLLANVATAGGVTRLVERVSGRWARISIHRIEPENRESPLAVVYRDIDSVVSAEEELKRLRLKILTIQEDERRAISQNLHDELGQGMTALLFTVRALDDVAPASPELSRAVRDATAQVELLTRRMRQIFYRIRPPSLRDASLPEAMADYCATTAQSSGLKILFDAEDAIPAMDGAKATALYRLLQEGLNNAIKHASAQSVWVTLGTDADSVYIAVEDDGRGFDKESSSAGIGIAGLRERFSMLEGDSHVDTRPGGGTRLSGSVPVNVMTERSAT
ncbi:sensor histidine kinase [Subtercola frigoramans]|uniref:Oxygen sensor histidine kinase NreB n=1 Tax=Subtercola frigoramans TaxID=120298 RepID=A0ABS2L9A1_9MICO|nr:sensor histidine kinase [Subtercola frigoramans]MBM7473654.1 signal transduction histidine kinase [Subtercola frigoramans]